MTPMSNNEKKGRWKLLLLIAVFLAPPIAALVLGAIGWKPGTSSHGAAVLPQRSVAEVVVTLADGSRYPWRDVVPRMTLVALPGPGCAERCLEQLGWMRNSRITLNEDQGRLRLLYLGTLPEHAAGQRVRQDWAIGSSKNAVFANWRPQAADSVAALLVESNGTVLLYYPPGFDANGLKKDLGEVIR